MVTTSPTSPLHARHVERNAKMADFAGWSMPIEYAGAGVVREHTAVREAVGLFDVSHLGKVLVRGERARDFINACFTNDLYRIGPGQAQYTMCCRADGGVVDDLIAYIRSDDEIFLIPNAANSAEVVRLLRAEAPEGIEIIDQHTEYGVIAVQGPASDDVLTALGLSIGHDYMSFVTDSWAGHEVTVCRTGYTGERGYELVVPWDATVEMWDGLVEQAAGLGGLPCGLGSRDTLRTEMGYPLHGQDLSEQITPVMARAAWAVGWDKPTFWGKETLAEQRAAKNTRLAGGLLVTGRGIPRAGCTVLDADGNQIGEVTSGTFSPTLRQGIALAQLDRGVPADTEVVIDVRGREVAAVVHKPPFVQAGVVRE